jgi:murein DD-endopeptidase MepM/ murein hydrolase activator NlpD
MEIYWPFDLARITEWCGTDRGGGVKHMGTDFGVPQGTPLRATISGRITRHNNDGLGAYVLDIVRSDGLLVRNAHLSRMDVNTGDQVVAGQVIGLTGGARGAAGSGNSTGPHLHWELRWDRLWQKGSWVDPRTMGVVQFGAAPAAPVAGRGDHIAAEGNDWTYWVPSTNDQRTVQQGLAIAGYPVTLDGNLASDESVRAIKLLCGKFGFFDLRFHDGVMNKNLCHGILLMAQAHGGYDGRMDWQIDGHVWAAFDSAIRATAPAPVVVPVPVVPPVVAPPVVEPEPEPVVEPEPVIVPAKTFAPIGDTSAVFANLPTEGTITMKTGLFGAVASTTFWNDLLTRAVNTGLQVTIAAVGVGAVGVLDLDYASILNLAAGGALVSVLTSFVRATTPKS